MRDVTTPNAMPLSRSQWSALLAATTRELGWGLRAVARELRRWRERALAIPDPALRRDALDALDHKRGHTDGAALFWTLPPRRDPELLRLLVRYELLQDFLDCASERRAALGPHDSRRLYRALADALDPERPPCDCYGPHGAHDDGGYLTALVTACRQGVGALPGRRAVGPLLAREAARAEVLVVNHLPDARERDEALRRWAARQLPGEPELRWYELTAAVSGWITTHALLALAADPAATTADAEAVHAAYFPWLALALTLLDSYADRAEDAAAGDHNYLAHFASDAAAVARLRESVGRAAAELRTLPDSERHLVLLACMVALYLSKDSARTPQLRATTAEIAAAGGSLASLLLPVLRAWRVCNGQRRTT